MVPLALPLSISEVSAVILVVPHQPPTPQLEETLPLLLLPPPTLMVPLPPIPSALALPRQLLTAMVHPPLIPSALVPPRPPLTATERLPLTPSALDQVCCKELFDRDRKMEKQIILFLLVALKIVGSNYYNCSFPLYLLLDKNTILLLMVDF